MWIKTITYEQLEGVYNKGKIIEENIEWGLIENIIKSLNGNTNTLVTLSYNLKEKSEIHMAIGGGNEGKYIVYLTYDNINFYYLINSLNLNEESGIELKVGGQYAEYPKQWCVSLDKVLLAAKTYAEKGEKDTTLNWEKD
jgi:hypothetical protein